MGHSDRMRGHNPLYKMNIPTWLTLILAVVTLSTPVVSAEPRVVCYYTNWSVYRPGTARFNPQNINPYLCTHLIYAFGGFTKDNTLKPFDKYQDIEKGGYAKFTGLKTYNKNLKTMLAIGGWNEGSTRFSPMVASRERRKEFVRNVIKFLRQNRFDGLDLDWEYPAFRDGGKPKDRENYSKLVRELREEFDREAEKTGRPRLLLTMAVPAGIEYIQKGFDVKTLNQYLDWMNLLTYDYHSAFEPAVNHHAPLYPLEEPNEYSVDTELNIDYTIKFYLENGADRDKLVLGIPTYGRSYTLFNADAVEIGSPADGPGEQGDATREKGYLAYYEICEALKPKNKKRSTDEDSEEDSEEIEEEWTVMHPNPDAMGPVAYRGNQWVGYDDIDIVKKKAQYVAENGLGGIMFWSIDNDDFRGNCHEKPYPLIEAAKEAYIGRIGSTGLVVTERAKVRPSAAKRRNRPKSTTTTTTVKPTVAKSNKRKNSVTSTTPAWNITPEPPTTPDPGSDFKCVDEGFYPHPRDCKKYFWCLDSGPSNLGIVAHQFTCPSGLFFNKAADSCDFARNVLCKMPAATTKAPATRAPSTTTTRSTTVTTRKPVRLSTKNSVLFRTTTTTTTTPEPESEEEYEEDVIPGEAFEEDAEDPRVIKELIDLIKKVGGVEQLEKQLHLAESAVTNGNVPSTTPSAFNKKLYQKVLERTRGKNKYTGKSISQESSGQNSRRGPQNQGLDAAQDKDRLLKKDRPQYTIINRNRPTTSPPESDSEEVEDPAPVQPSRARAVAAEDGTTTRPLQYVNIRRARPTTSDTADDTASRNALFERAESYVTVSEPNSLDIVNARRENQPEYVTIRRQRPSTEETTTVRFEDTKESQEVELQETVLEREISSQPQYTSIVRTRATTHSPEPTTSEPEPRTRPTTASSPEKPSSPEPTTILAVQISSFLNSPSSDEPSVPDTTVAQTTEAETTTTSATTTTVSPSTTTTRRPIIRRRGSTTTTTAPPTVSSSTTQPRRQFLRRTKPPSLDANTTEVANQQEVTKKVQVPRGPSKFSRNETRRLNTNGGARRTERPSRNFVRRRPEGSVSTSSPASPSASSTSGTVTRRPFRIASRRRPSSTAATTSTTAATTTLVLESDEFLQDIGDIDAIEDPTLEPRAPKKAIKSQRRPLVNLKAATVRGADKSADQNPSATNEETKRQSKKYSSTFKQNQLDGLLKKEDTSTTLDDYNAETILAIATHKLLTAPLPSINDYDEPQTKTTQTDRTTDYTPTPTDISSSFGQYDTTRINTDKSDIDAGKVTFEYPRTTFEATHIPTNDYEFTTPGTIKTFATYDVTNVFTTPDVTKEYTTPDVTKVFTTPGRTNTFATSDVTQEFTTSDVTKEYTTPDVTKVFTTPGRTNTFATSDVTQEFTTPDVTKEYATSDITEEYTATDVTKVFTTPERTNTFATSDFTQVFTSPDVTKEYATPDITQEYATSDVTKEYATPDVTKVFTTPGRTKTFATSDVTQVFTSPDVTEEYATPGVTKVFTTPRRTKTFATSDVTKEYATPDVTKLYSTPDVTKVFTTPRTAKTYATSDVTKVFTTPRTAKTFATPDVTKVYTTSEVTGYTGYTGIRRGTVKFSEFPTNPTVAYDRYPTRSNQERSDFTREYLLKSPVTKTYDAEYQYLSPTTPQTPRKVFRKKIQRRISTTLRPTVAFTETNTSPDARTLYSPRLTSTYDSKVTSQSTYEPKVTSTRNYEPKVTSPDPITTSSPRTYLPRVTKPSGFVPKVTAANEYWIEGNDKDYLPEVTSRPFVPEVTSRPFVPEVTSRPYVPEVTSRTYVPEVTSIRNYLQEVSTTRNYLPEVSSTTNYSPEVNPTRNYSPEVSTTRNYSPEMSSTRNYSPEVSSKRNYTPEVSSTRNYSPEVSSTRNYSPEVSSTRNYSPEVSTTRNYSPEVTTPRPFKKVTTPKPKSKKTYKPVVNFDYYDDSAEKIALKYAEGTKVIYHGKGSVECLDVGNFPHPSSCKKFISCARMEFGSLLGWEYVCPKGLSFDPVGGICNWSAGLGCDEKDI